MFTEVVYAGRDNTIDLQLTDDTAERGSQNNADFSAVTKVSLMLDGAVAYDSEANPGVVSYTPDALVTLRLGGVLSTKGAYVAEFLVHSASAPNGVNWEPQFYISVIA